MNNELKKTCTRSLFMQFKREFSMHPNNQTTCTLRDLASLKQTACLCLIPSRSSALYVRTQTSTGTCVSDCIGGWLKICACICKKPVLVLSHAPCVCVCPSQLPDNVWVYAWLHAFVCLCLELRRPKCEMRAIEIDVLNPSSIESSSQFRCSCNAGLLSILSIFVVATELFRRNYASNSTHFFSFCLFWLDSFIHMLLAFFGGRLLNTVPFTSELKYSTNEWWWCCCCCYNALVLISIEINFHLVFVCWRLCCFASQRVLFALSFHTRTHIQNTYTFLCVSFTFASFSALCVSSLWPFRINSMWVCRDGVTVAVYCSLSYFSVLSLFVSFDSYSIWCVSECYVQVLQTYRKFK